MTKNLQITVNNVISIGTGLLGIDPPRTAKPHSWLPVPFFNECAYKECENEPTHRRIPL